MIVKKQLESSSI